MGLDCIITVAGNDAGRSGHGVPKVSLRGPVSRFIRDSQSYYATVLKHLETCGKCDPQEALEGFLRNRDKPKHSGKTSGLLMKMAVRYKRKFGVRVSRELVCEFVVRGMSNWDEFCKQSYLLSGKDIDRALEFEIGAWRADMLGVLAQVDEALAKRRPIGPLLRKARRSPFRRTMIRRTEFVRNADANDRIRALEERMQSLDLRGLIEGDAGLSRLFRTVDVHAVLSE